MRLKRLAVTAALLGSWYLTNPAPEPKAAFIKYDVPREIRVQEFSYDRQRILGEREQGLEGVIRTADIDFSRGFVLRTHRYTLVKDEDNTLSRMVGDITSIPRKLYFWDSRVSAGLDEERVKAVLGMLEADKSIRDVTVRINHNRAIYDTMRLFTDEKVVERNNIVARVAIGVPTMVMNELWAELFRGDYYNPMTQTAVVYSGIEAIPAHELGHHKDFQRFPSDWGYAIAGVFPPVRLYQEWQASRFGKESLGPYDEWQFNRYLIPAFCTYLLGAWATHRRVLQRRKRREFAEAQENEPARDAQDGMPPTEITVKPWETARHLVSANAAFYAGIAGYSWARSRDAHELLAYAVFAAALYATDEALERVGAAVLPYEMPRPATKTGTSARQAGGKRAIPARA